MTFSQFMRGENVAVTIGGEDWEAFCERIWDTAFQEGKEEGLKEGREESNG